MLQFNCNTPFFFSPSFISNEGRPCFPGKETYSPDVESSPAPSSTDPGVGQPHSKQSSRGNSFEIENLLKTAGEVSRKKITNSCERRCITNIQSRDYYNQLGFH